MNAKFATTIIPIILFAMLAASVGLYSVKFAKGEISRQPFPTLEPLPEAPTGKPVGELVSEARADLAERLGVSQTEITTKRVESIVWNDASLGCPEPGKYYAQVTTPGYKITLKAKGQAYFYHASRALAKLCKKDL